MRNSSKMDEASKSKDDQQVSLIPPVQEIRRVAVANQMRLQQLELAVANLTSICSAIRHDMYSLSSSLSNQGSFTKVQAEVVEMKRPSYTRTSSSSLELKDDVLGVQLQQLVKQAAALGILNSSPIDQLSAGNVKENSKIPIRSTPKKVQATLSKKDSTKQPVQRMELTTEKKLSMKHTTVKNNNMGATQSKTAKAPPESSAGNNLKATSTAAKFSLKSTVKRTKTTISKVYVNQPPIWNKGKETIVKNVQKIQGKGSIKLTVKTHQGRIKPDTAPKSHASTKKNSSPGAVKSDLKPRRKWSTAEAITLKK
ncbi:uncharacterized protein [Spinacia oleracea]|uniref:Uncharacterized protein n=1 Tax=Spinacia oleracea TaxID=3562 RepID=A0ABM3R1Q1_SPIOL|nr:uncharacterized protein LOC110798372 [Spinacia oleracea]